MNAKYQYAQDTNITQTNDGLTIKTTFVKTSVIIADSSFGEKLRKLLKHYGMTQKQLSDETKISCATINKYIRNIRKPKISKVNKIADALGVTRTFLNRGN